MKNIWSRRDFLFRSGGGVSGLALAYLLNQEGLLGAGACDAKASGYNPYAPKNPHFAPRAKSVISLFMSGGVSHIDTFDPKPALARYAGQPLTGKGEIVVRQGNPGPLMPTPFTFRKYGQNGIDVSEIFPHIVRHVERSRASGLHCAGRHDSHGFAVPGVRSYVRAPFRNPDPARLGSHI